MVCLATDCFDLKYVLYTELLLVLFNRKEENILGNSGLSPRDCCEVKLGTLCE